MTPDSSPADAESTTSTPDDTTESEQTYLEITLGDERYAFDVSYVDEIVEANGISRMPNTPACIRGLIDLRGRVTTVLDPTIVLDPPGEPANTQLIVVFDPEQLDQQGTVGWLVDDVQRVRSVAEDGVTDPPERNEWMGGVIRTGDQDGYTVLITPELVFSEVEEIVEDYRTNEPA